MTEAQNIIICCDAFERMYINGDIDKEGNTWVIGCGSDMGFDPNWYRISFCPFCGKSAKEGDMGK